MKYNKDKNLEDSIKSKLIVGTKVLFLKSMRALTVIDTMLAPISLAAYLNTISDPIEQSVQLHLYGALIGITSVTVYRAISAKIDNIYAKTNNSKQTILDESKEI